jgi:hypothetical protein
MPTTRHRNTRHKPVLGVAIALLVTGCAAAIPQSPEPSSPAASSPAATSSAGPSGSPAGPVTSPEQAAEAVARFDSNFLGYSQRDPDLIGQSAWFEAKPVAGGFELTFFRGEGDCPAGCIERSFIKFFVSRDGAVEKRCEWQEGNGSKATPC